MLFYRDRLMVAPVETHDIRRERRGRGHRPPTPADVRVMARANVDEVLKRLPCIAPTLADEGERARRCRRRTAPCRRACCTWWRRPSTPSHSRMEPTWAAWL